MQKEKNQKSEFKKLGFLGGDVSKGMCNFVLLNESGKELEPNFQLDDNREGIVMTKLARVMYGMLKSRKPFESTIDIANKEKLVHKNSKKKNKLSQDRNTNSKEERRYQNKQNKAPVSMTQRVKRKQEQTVSS